MQEEEYEIQQYAQNVHIGEQIIIENNPNDEQITLEFWEEKKSTFVKLKLWEDERSNFYSVIQSSRHRVLTDSILARILHKNSVGREANLATARFLKSQSDNYNLFASNIKSQLNFLPSASPELAAGTLKFGLAGVNTLQLQLMNNMKELSTYIEQDILKGYLGELLIEYDDKVMSFQQKAEAVKRELDQYNLRAVKAFKDHVQLFKAIEIAFSNPGVLPGCIWLSERRYIHAAVSQHELQRALANVISTFWTQLRQLEQQRVKAIKQAMQDFLDKQYQNFHIQDQEALEALQNVSEDVASRLNTEKLVTQSELEVLQELGGSDDPLQALTNWSLPIPPQTNLVVKEGVMGRTSEVLKQWRECYVVVTKVKFLHIFAAPVVQTFQEPIKSLFLVGTKIRVGTEPGTIEILESKQSRLFGMLSSQKKVVLKVEEIEEVNEWLGCLKDLNF